MFMKKLFTLWTACMLVVGLVQAQPVSIITARGLATGATVTVAGVVMNGAELGPIRYIDDGTAGIGIYLTATQAAGVVKGDSIVVTGTVAPFNNLMELTPVSSLQVVSQNNPLHGPFQFNANNWSAAFNELYEGRLVKLNRVPKVTTTAGAPVTTFAANTNYRLNADAALVARVNVASTQAIGGIVGRPAPSDTFDVTGVMSQFSSSLPTSGYQLLPRLYDDFFTGPSPNIITRVYQTAVTQTSLTIGFLTQNNGSTRIEYGPTPSLGTLIDDPNLTTNHSLVLNNLEPGKIYYVKATSTNANGTSEATVTTFVTESNSSGKIKTYFTRPVRTDEALPGNEAAYLAQAVDDTLIAYINRAQLSLDIAIYNWNNSNLSNITAAVNAAYNRGVAVRVIADGASANIGLNGLNTAIKVLRSPTGAAPGGGFYGIMHNKFVVIDAEATDPNQPWLWTGSTNWTDDMINQDWNNVIVFQDQSLARVYKLEFEEMWGSSTLTPGIVFNGTTGTAKFGPNKTDNTPHIVKVGGRTVNPYFSPSDGVQSRLVETINSANSSFQFSIFTFTRNEIAFALRDKYQALGPGNCSRGLIDDTNSTDGSGTAFRIAASSMGTNYNIFTPAGIYHHKYIIVDQDNAASDPMVFTGSHNWSAAADTRNDENTVIVHDQLIANQYYQEFSARWADDNQTNCLTTAVAPSIASRIELAPNPASETVKVTLPGMVGRTIRVIGTDGRICLSLRANAETMTLPVSTLQAGAYLVQVEGIAVPVRFVKQ